jgi:hypothetical protein
VRHRGVGLVLVAVALLLTGCGEGQEPTGGGGSGAPALRSLLTDVSVPDVEPTAVPTTTAVEEQGFEHSSSALRGLGDDPELDALALACHQADLSACDDLYVAAPAGSLYEAYGATCGARLDEATSSLCADALVGVPEEAPSTGDELLDELARQCSAGDLVDCDLLYAESDTGSEAERYGATCGGRLETEEDCAALVV